MLLLIRLASSLNVAVQLYIHLSSTGFFHLHSGLSLESKHWTCFYIMLYNSGRIGLLHVISNECFDIFLQRQRLPTLHYCTLQHVTYLFSRIYSVKKAMLLTVCLTSASSKVTTVKSKSFCLLWKMQVKARQRNDVSPR